MLYPDGALNIALRTTTHWLNVSWASQKRRVERTMAPLYAADITKVAPEVLSAARALPEDVILFTEFTVNGREVDLMALRPRPSAPCTLMVAEIKGACRPIRGTDNGPWEIQTENGSWEPWHTRYRDSSAYRQVVATANAVAEWLWLNQPRFLASNGGTLPKKAFSVWPDVIIESPPGVEHQLPLGPSSRYGGWFYGIEPWVQHVAAWSSRASVVSLTTDDVIRLAAALDLSPVHPPVSTAPAASMGCNAANAAGITAFVTWLSQLEHRLSALESR